MDYIYLRAGTVRPGGVRVKTNLIFLSWGALGGSKQIITKKWGGGRGNFFFFSITSVRITFFSNVRVRQEGGMILAN